MQEIPENLELENQIQEENTFVCALGDIFGEKEYPIYYQWTIENGYTLSEIEHLGGTRRFQVVELAGVPELTYVQKRLAEYPSIGDQLDMIYWDKVNGTNLWQEKITEIKNKYPKS